MILFIFNGIFPADNGFAMRCKRAIDTLSENESVEILCRENEKNKLFYSNKNGKFPIYIFKPFSPTIDLATNYVSGLYEAIRNIDLIVQLGLQTFKLFFKHRDTNLKIYVVNSPLTVPLIVLILSKLFKVTLDIVEFHDLEPELAIQIKKINKQNIVYKIEIFLEKLICQSFNKIIVTTRSQANIISRRTNTPLKNILIIPNTVDSSENKIAKSTEISSNNFNIGYFSTFSYEYTIKELIILINQFKKIRSEVKNAKLILAGNGIGITHIQDAIKRNNLLEHVIMITDNKKNPELLKQMNVCLIPWSRNEMTETMLPTKLFQYMAASKAIIAPNFGEFRRILTNKEDSLLYKTIDELITNIKKLSKNKNLEKYLGTNAYKTYRQEYSPNIFHTQLLDFTKV